MQIMAWALSKWTGNRWTVADTKIEKMTAEGIGSVQLRFATKPLSLSGQFNMQITLSAEEISEIYRLSLTGPAENRIADLEKQLKKITQAAVQVSLPAPK